MGVKIDKAGRHDCARCVDDAPRVRGPEPADPGNLAVLDPDIGPVPRHPGPIDDQPIPDDRIELWHWRASLRNRHLIYWLTNQRIPISATYQLSQRRPEPALRAARKDAGEGGRWPQRKNRWSR